MILVNERTYHIKIPYIPEAQNVFKIQNETTTYNTQPRHIPLNNACIVFRNYLYSVYIFLLHRFFYIIQMLNLVGALVYLLF